MGPSSKPNSNGKHAYHTKGTKPIDKVDKSTNTIQPLSQSKLQQKSRPRKKSLTKPSPSLLSTPHRQISNLNSSPFSTQLSTQLSTLLSPGLPNVIRLTTRKKKLSKPFSTGGSLHNFSTGGLTPKTPKDQSNDNTESTSNKTTNDSQSLTTNPPTSHDAVTNPNATAPPTNTHKQPPKKNDTHNNNNNTPSAQKKPVQKPIIISSSKTTETIITAKNATNKTTKSKLSPSLLQNIPSPPPPHQPPTKHVFQPLKQTEHDNMRIKPNIQMTISATPSNLPAIKQLPLPKLQATRMEWGVEKPISPLNPIFKLIGFQRSRPTSVNPAITSSSQPQQTNVINFNQTNPMDPTSLTNPKNAGTLFAHLLSTTQLFRRYTQPYNRIPFFPDQFQDLEQPHVEFPVYNSVTPNPAHKLAATGPTATPNPWFLPRQSTSKRLFVQPLTPLRTPMSVMMLTLKPDDGLTEQSFSTLTKPKTASNLDDDDYTHSTPFGDDDDDAMSTLPWDNIHTNYANDDDSNDDDDDDGNNNSNNADNNYTNANSSNRTISRGRRVVDFESIKHSLELTLRQRTWLLPGDEFAFKVTPDPNDPEAYRIAFSTRLPLSYIYPEVFMFDKFNALVCGLEAEQINWPPGLEDNMDVLRTFFRYHKNGKLAFFPAGHEDRTQNVRIVHSPPITPELIQQYKSAMSSKDAVKSARNMLGSSPQSLGMFASLLNKSHDSSPSDYSKLRDMVYKELSRRTQTLVRSRNSAIIQHRVSQLNSLMQRDQSILPNVHKLLQGGEEESALTDPDGKQWLFTHSVQYKRNPPTMLYNSPAIQNYSGIQNIQNAAHNNHLGLLSFYQPNYDINLNTSVNDSDNVHDEITSTSKGNKTGSNHSNTQTRTGAHAGADATALLEVSGALISQIANKIAPPPPNSSRNQTAQQLKAYQASLTPLPLQSTIVSQFFTQFPRATTYRVEESYGGSSIRLLSTLYRSNALRPAGQELNQQNKWKSNVQTKSSNFTTKSSLFPPHTDWGLVPTRLRQELSELTPEGLEDIRAHSTFTQHFIGDLFNYYFSPLFYFHGQTLPWMSPSELSTAESNFKSYDIAPVRITGSYFVLGNDKGGTQDPANTPNFLQQYNSFLAAQQRGEPVTQAEYDELFIKPYLPKTSTNEDDQQSARRKKGPLSTTDSGRQDSNNDDNDDSNNNQKTDKKDKQDEFDITLNQETTIGLAREQRLEELDRLTFRALVTMKYREKESDFYMKFIPFAPQKYNSIGDVKRHNKDDLDISTSTFQTITVQLPIVHLLQSKYIPQALLSASPSPAVPPPVVTPVIEVVPADEHDSKLTGQAQKTKKLPEPTHEFGILPHLRGKYAQTTEPETKEDALTKPIPPAPAAPSPSQISFLQRISHILQQPSSGVSVNKFDPQTGTLVLRYRPMFKSHNPLSKGNFSEHNLTQRIPINTNARLSTTTLAVLALFQNLGIDLHQFGSGKKMNDIGNKHTTSDGYVVLPVDHSIVDVDTTNDLEDVPKPLSPNKHKTGGNAPGHLIADFSSFSSPHIDFGRSIGLNIVESIEYLMIRTGAIAMGLNPSNTSPQQPFQSISAGTQQQLLVLNREDVFSVRGLAHGYEFQNGFHLTHQKARTNVPATVSVNLKPIEEIDPSVLSGSSSNPDLYNQVQTHEQRRLGALLSLTYKPLFRELHTLLSKSTYFSGDVNGTEYSQDNADALGDVSNGFTKSLQRAIHSKKLAQKKRRLLDLNIYDYSYDNLDQIIELLLETGTIKHTIVSDQHVFVTESGEALANNNILLGFIAPININNDIEHLTQLRHVNPIKHALVRNDHEKNDTIATKSPRLKNTQGDDSDNESDSDGSNSSSSSETTSDSETNNGNETKMDFSSILKPPTSRPSSSSLRPGSGSHLGMLNTSDNNSTPDQLQNNKKAQLNPSTSPQKNPKFNQNRSTHFLDSIPSHLRPTITTTTPLVPISLPVDAQLVPQLAEIASLLQYSDDTTVDNTTNPQQRNNKLSPFQSDFSTEADFKTDMKAYTPTRFIPANNSQTIRALRGEMLTFQLKLIDDTIRDLQSLDFNYHLLKSPSPQTSTGSKNPNNTSATDSNNSHSQPSNDTPSNDVPESGYQFKLKMSQLQRIFVQTGHIISAFTHQLNELTTGYQPVANTVGQHPFLNRFMLRKEFTALLPSPLQPSTSSPQSKRDQLQPNLAPQQQIPYDAVVETIALPQLSKAKRFSLVYDILLQLPPDFDFRSQVLALLAGQRVHFSALHKNSSDIRTRKFHGRSVPMVMDANDHTTTVKMTDETGALFLTSANPLIHVLSTLVGVPVNVFVSQVGFVSGLRQAFTTADVKLYETLAQREQSHEANLARVYKQQQLSASERLHHTPLPNLTAGMSDPKLSSLYGSEYPFALQLPRVITDDEYFHLRALLALQASRHASQKTHDNADMDEDEGDDDGDDDESKPSKKEGSKKRKTSGKELSGMNAKINRQGDETITQYDNLLASYISLCIEHDIYPPNEVIEPILRHALKTNITSTDLLLEACSHFGKRKIFTEAIIGNYLKNAQLAPYQYLFHQSQNYQLGPLVHLPDKPLSIFSSLPFNAYQQAIQMMMSNPDMSFNKSAIHTKTFFEDVAANMSMWQSRVPYFEPMLSMLQSHHGKSLETKRNNALRSLKHILCLHKPPKSKPLIHCEQRTNVVDATLVGDDDDDDDENDNASVTTALSSLASTEQIDLLLSPIKDNSSSSLPSPTDTNNTTADVDSIIMNEMRQFYYSREHFPQLPIVSSTLTPTTDSNLKKGSQTLKLSSTQNKPHDVKNPQLAIQMSAMNTTSILPPESDDINNQMASLQRYSLGHLQDIISASLQMNRSLLQSSRLDDPCDHLLIHAVAPVFTSLGRIIATPPRHVGDSNKKKTKVLASPLLALDPSIIIDFINTLLDFDHPLLVQRFISQLTPLNTPKTVLDDLLSDSTLQSQFKRSLHDNIGDEIESIYHTYKQQLNEYNSNMSSLESYHYLFNDILADMNESILPKELVHIAAKTSRPLTDSQVLPHPSGYVHVPDDTYRQFSPLSASSPGAEFAPKPLPSRNGMGPWHSPFLQQLLGHTQLDTPLNKTQIDQANDDIIAQITKYVHNHQQLDTDSALPTSTTKTTTGNVTQSILKPAQFTSPLGVLSTLQLTKLNDAIFSEKESALFNAALKRGEGDQVQSLVHQIYGLPQRTVNTLQNVRSNTDTHKNNNRQNGLDGNDNNDSNNNSGGDDDEQALLQRYHKLTASTPYDRAVVYQQPPHLTQNTLITPETANSLRAPYYWLLNNAFRHKTAELYSREFLIDIAFTNKQTHGTSSTNRLFGAPSAQINKLFGTNYYQYRMYSPATHVPHATEVHPHPTLFYSSLSPAERSHLASWTNELPPKSRDIYTYAYGSPQQTQQIIDTNASLQQIHISIQPPTQATATTLFSKIKKANSINDNVSQKSNHDDIVELYQPYPGETAPNFVDPVSALNVVNFWQLPSPSASSIHFMGTGRGPGATLRRADTLFAPETLGTKSLLQQNVENIHAKSRYDPLFKLVDTSLPYAVNDEFNDGVYDNAFDNFKVILHHTINKLHFMKQDHIILNILSYITATNQHMKSEAQTTGVMNQIFNKSWTTGTVNLGLTALNYHTKFTHHIFQQYSTQLQRRKIFLEHEACTKLEDEPPVTKVTKKSKKSRRKAKASKSEQDPLLTELLSIHHPNENSLPTLKTLTQFNFPKKTEHEILRRQHHLQLYLSQDMLLSLASIHQLQHDPYSLNADDSKPIGITPADLHYPRLLLKSMSKIVTQLPLQDVSLFKVYGLLHDYANEHDVDANNPGDDSVDQSVDSMFENTWSPVGLSQDYAISTMMPTITSLILNGKYDLALRVIAMLTVEGQQMTPFTDQFLAKVHQHKLASNNANDKTQLDSTFIQTLEQLVETPNIDTQTNVQTHFPERIASVQTLEARRGQFDMINSRSPALAMLELLTTYIMDRITSRPTVFSSTHNSKTALVDMDETATTQRAMEATTENNIPSTLYLQTPLLDTVNHKNHEYESNLRTLQQNLAHNEGDVLLRQQSHNDIKTLTSNSPNFVQKKQQQQLGDQAHESISHQGGDNSKSLVDSSNQTFPFTGPHLEPSLEAATLPGHAVEKDLDEILDPSIDVIASSLNRHNNGVKLTAPTTKSLVSSKFTPPSQHNVEAHVEQSAHVVEQLSTDFDNLTKSKLTTPQFTQLLRTSAPNIQHHIFMVTQSYTVLMLGVAKSIENVFKAHEQFQHTSKTYSALLEKTRQRDPTRNGLSVSNLIKALETDAIQAQEHEYTRTALLNDFLQQYSIKNQSIQEQDTSQVQNQDRLPTIVGFKLPFPRDFDSKLYFHSAKKQLKSSQTQTDHSNQSTTSQQHNINDLESSFYDKNLQVKPLDSILLEESTPISDQANYYKHKRFVKTHVNDAIMKWQRYVHQVGLANIEAIQADNNHFIANRSHHSHHMDNNAGNDDAGQAALDTTKKLLNMYSSSSNRPFPPATLTPSEKIPQFQSTANNNDMTVLDQNDLAESTTRFVQKLLSPDVLSMAVASPSPSPSTPSSSPSTTSSTTTSPTTLRDVSVQQVLFNHSISHGYALPIKLNMHFYDHVTSESILIHSLFKNTIHQFITSNTSTQSTNQSSPPAKHTSPQWASTSYAHDMAQSLWTQTLTRPLAPLPPLSILSVISAQSDDVNTINNLNSDAIRNHLKQNVNFKHLLSSSFYNIALLMGSTFDSLPHFSPNNNQFDTIYDDIIDKVVSQLVPSDTTLSETNQSVPILDCSKMVVPTLNTIAESLTDGCIALAIAAYPFALKQNHANLNTIDDNNSPVNKNKNNLITSCDALIPQGHTFRNIFETALANPLLPNSKVRKVINKPNQTSNDDTSVNDDDITYTPGLDYNKFEHSLQSHYIPTVASSVGNVIRKTTSLLPLETPPPATTTDSIPQTQTLSPTTSPTETTTQKTSPAPTTTTSTPHTSKHNQNQGQALPSLAALSKTTLSSLLEYYANSQSDPQSQLPFERFLFSTQQKLMKHKKEHLIQSVQSMTERHKTNPQGLRFTAQHKNLYSVNDCFGMMNYLNYLVQSNQNNDSNLLQLTQLLPIFLTYTSTSSLQPTLIIDFLNNLLHDLTRPLIDSLNISNNTLDRGEFIAQASSPYSTSPSRNPTKIGDTSVNGAYRLTMPQIQSRIDVIMSVFASVSTLPIYAQMASHVDESLGLFSHNSYRAQSIGRSKWNKSQLQSIAYFRQDEGFVPSSKLVDDAFAPKYFTPTPLLFNTLLKLLFSNNVLNGDNLSLQSPTHHANNADITSTHVQQSLQSHEANDHLNKLAEQYNLQESVQPQQKCTVSIDTTRQFITVFQKLLKSSTLDHYEINKYYAVWEEVVHDHLPPHQISPQPDTMNTKNQHHIAANPHQRSSLSPSQPHNQVSHADTQLPTRDQAISMMFQGILQQPHILKNPQTKSDLLLVLGLSLFRAKKATPPKSK